MEIAMILLLVSMTITQFLLFFLVFRRFEKAKKALIASVKAYFEAPDEQTPSEFAGVVNAVADVFVTKAMASIKGSLMQQASVNSRNMKTLEEAAIIDVASQNDFIGTALETFPNLKKIVSKNPNLLNLAIPFISKMQNKSAIPVSGNGNGSSQTKFTL
jgi:hypothetical protein